MISKHYILYFTTRPTTHYTFCAEEHQITLLQKYTPKRSASGEMGDDEPIDIGLGALPPSLHLMGRTAKTADIRYQIVKGLY